VDRFTEQEVWRRTLYRYVWGAPVAHEGRTYPGTQAVRLYALDAAGATVWETKLEGGSKHLAVCGDKVVVENYQVELFDIASGQRIGTKIQLAPGDFASSGIAVTDGRAFFASQQKIYAIRCG
jgi:outer membrane protein assembly factor BamB